MAAVVTFYLLDDKSDRKVSRAYFLGKCFDPATRLRHVPSSMPPSISSTT